MTTTDCCSRLLTGDLAADDSDVTDDVTDALDDDVVSSVSEKHVTSDDDVWYTCTVKKCEICIDLPVRKNSSLF